MLIPSNADCGTCWKNSWQGWAGCSCGLLRGERSGLGIWTIVLGASSLIDFLGTLLQFETLAVPGLTVYLFMAPVWAFWTGILLLRADALFVANKTEVQA
jgi:hypothetical protein